jgi:hypothetical protein
VISFIIPAMAGASAKNAALAWAEKRKAQAGPLWDQIIGGRGNPHKLSI